MAQIIGLGNEHDRNSIDLATSRGRRIANARRREQAKSALQASVEMFRDARPNARLRSLTATYNCFGMVFANRRTWVDSTEVPMILEDDNYREVNLQDVLPGDIVLYRNDSGELTHVGVVICHSPDLENARWNTVVLSKWGANGEYLHDVGDVNLLLGKPDKFYSERRQIE